jgi:hypothetical protein
MERESEVFDGEWRGYQVRAHYLKPPDNQDALVEVLKDGEIVRSFRYPAYRVWNVAAHADDLIDEIEAARAAD